MITNHMKLFGTNKLKCLSFSGSKGILLYSSSKRRCSSLKITQGWNIGFYTCPIFQIFISCFKHLCHSLCVAKSHFKL